MKPESAGGIFINSKSRALSKEELRSFLVRYHALDNFDRLAPHGAADPAASAGAGIKKLLRRIGSVQYDPLNVVGRNPDLVFQSRVKDYRAGFLDELLYGERSLVDGWDKEMSIYLTADWPYFSRIRRSRKKEGESVLTRRGQDDVLSFLPQVMEEIRIRGPLRARDIKLGATRKNRWGHRQISGAALDYLYAAGELGIYGRKNAQKMYGLVENLIPGKISCAPDPFADDEAFLEWYVLRRIGSMGALWARNGSGWLGHYLRDSVRRKKTLGVLEEKKLAVPFAVPEINETVYIRRKDISLLNEKDSYDDAARILAPLDNMLWDRLFVQKVFDFQYTWEVYVPAEKRKYGYYVLPVLYRNSLIARLEPARHEKGRPFAIKNWWHERGLKINPEIKEAVKKGLENFARYLSADGVDKASLDLFADPSGCR